MNRHADSAVSSQVSSVSNPGLGWLLSVHHMQLLDVKAEQGVLLLQLSTTEGNSYYVGTKMDAFVYDTLNAWYQEDMGTVSVHSIGLRLSVYPDQLHDT